MARTPVSSLIMPSLRPLSSERIAADNVKVLRHALDTLYAANEFEEHLKGKIKADEEARSLKEFIAQPDEKPRFERFLADKQEEARRAEMERQTRLATRKSALSRDDGGPSFSPR